MIWQLQVLYSDVLCYRHQNRRRLLLYPVPCGKFSSGIIAPASGDGQTTRQAWCSKEEFFTYVLITVWMVAKALSKVSLAIKCESALGIYWRKSNDYVEVSQSEVNAHWFDCIKIKKSSHACTIFSKMKELMWIYCPNFDDAVKIWSGHRAQLISLL